MKQWHALAQKFNQMTPREQGLVLSTGLFLLVFFVFTLWLDPLGQQAREQQQTLAQIQQTNQSLQQQTQVLAAALTRDPNDGIRKQLDVLQQEINQQDQRLGELTLDLVSPSQMLPVLHNLLQKASDVQVLSLASIPAVAVMKNENRPDLGIFKHSIELKVSGSYFQIYELLKAIEQSPWRFYWQAMHYQVTAYPSAEVTIELYTLSTSEDYIRV